MGMSQSYGPTDWDESTATIHRALDLGVTLLDTANVYGAGHNEGLVVEHIDLYYLHRPPEDAEIEETVGAMAELVGAGKVRYLGLSEVDDALLRRAYAVHPVAAVQSEYSLWTRDPETTVLGALRE